MSLTLYVNICDPDFSLDTLKECIADAKFKHSVVDFQTDLKHYNHRVIIIDVVYNGSATEIADVLSHFSSRITKHIICSTIIAHYIKYSAWMIAGGKKYPCAKDPYASSDKPAKKKTENHLGLKIIKGGKIEP